MTAFTAHFGLGMAAGTALAAPALWRRWQARAPLSGAFGRWILLAYGLGLFAIVPNALVRLGLPASWCASPVMNVFLLHPLLDRFGRGGEFRGAALIFALFALQYVLLLEAIRRRGWSPPRARSARSRQSPRSAP